MQVEQARVVSAQTVQLVGHRVQVFPTKAYPAEHPVHTTVEAGLLQVTQFATKKEQLLHWSLGLS